MQVILSPMASSQIAVRCQPVISRFSLIVRCLSVILTAPRHLNMGVARVRNGAKQTMVRASLRASKTTQRVGVVQHKLFMILLKSIR